MSNSEVQVRRLNATPRGMGVMCDFYAVKAENATLWDHGAVKLSISAQALPC